MASRFTRTAALAARSATATTARIAAPAAAIRRFHASRPAFVKAGQQIPSLDALVENSPGDKVDLGEALAKGKGLIIGVPGAFSPGCSEKHVPSYIQHPGLKDAGQVFVVSVNDAFVMKAWGVALDPEQKSGIRFLGDPAGTFTKALDLDFDATPIFGNHRSKRYALVVEDGKVKEAHVEPDNTGIAVSTAEKVLGA